MERLAFRPDVEGLRALAVVAVLLFHSGFSETFSGGFVGVDVFFVISGFLITGNVLSQATAGRFRFRDFYLRRIRRLFPALLFTSGLTVAVGAIAASPAELVKIAESAVASIFSVSNVYFWSEAGYFDSSAIQKPLLHTWSLAVEEQFYLVWPAVVVLLARWARDRRHAVAVLTLLAVWSTWAAQRAIGVDSSAAFYLAPYRVAEFALGAICAWMPAKRKVPPLLLDGVALFGLGLMLSPVFSYSEATAFPGLNALVPCAGTALLIHFGNSRVARLLLANGLAVGIGRISYSVYLAHWPVYVFLWQWGGKPGATASIAGGVVSIALAVLMYRFVEQPFRVHGAPHEATISTRRFAQAVGSMTAVTVAIAAAIWVGGGWSWRFSDDLSRLTRETESEKAARFAPYLNRCLKPDSVSCDEPSASVNVFILGDSHAPDAFNALATTYPDYHYVLHGVPGCPPLAQEDYNLLTSQHPDRAGCIALNDKVLQGVQLSQADLIIINVLFAWYQQNHLARAIEQIRRRTEAPIMVLGNYLVFDEEVPDMVLRHGQTTMDSYYEAKLSWQSFAFEKELQELSTRARFTYVSKRQLFCRGAALLDCPLMFDHKLFTYDRHHLSIAAATTMGRALKRRYDSQLAALGAPRHARQRSAARK